MGSDGGTGRGSHYWAERGSLKRNTAETKLLGPSGAAGKGPGSCRDYLDLALLRITGQKGVA